MSTAYYIADKFTVDYFVSRLGKFNSLAIQDKDDDGFTIFDSNTNGFIRIRCNGGVIETIDVFSNSSIKLFLKIFNIFKFRFINEMDLGHVVNIYSSIDFESITTEELWELNEIRRIYNGA
jgi:hypothetical protein